MILAYLALMIFLGGWWLGDEMVLGGYRRQVARGVIWETDKVLVLVIPATVDRNKPWEWAIWQV